MKRMLRVMVFGVALAVSLPGYASSEEEDDEDEEEEEELLSGGEEEEEEEEEPEQLAECEAPEEGEDGEELSEESEEECVDPETKIAGEEPEDPEPEDFPEDPTLTTTIEQTPAFPDEDPVPVPNPPVVVEEPISNPTPNPTPWVPQNNGPWRPQIAQSEIKIHCIRVGEGTPGYVRYGCKSLKKDGSPYGIVIGWWRVLKRDGQRARTKHLNFRVTGYDMAFDVYAPDAASGIQVQPGWGEQKPLGRR